MAYQPYIDPRFIPSTIGGIFQKGNAEMNAKRAGNYLNAPSELKPTRVAVAGVTPGVDGPPSSLANPPKKKAPLVKETDPNFVGPPKSDWRNDSRNPDPKAVSDFLTKFAFGADSAPKERSEATSPMFPTSPGAPMPGSAALNATIARIDDSRKTLGSAEAARQASLKSEADAKDAAIQKAHADRMAKVNADANAKAHALVSDQLRRDPTTDIGEDFMRSNGFTEDEIADIRNRIASSKSERKAHLERTNKLSEDLAAMNKRFDDARQEDLRRAEEQRKNSFFNRIFSAPDMSGYSRTGY